MDNLDKISIDTDICWPRYSDRLLRAPSPVPQDYYVKGADFFYYNNDPEAKPLSDLVSHEIEAYEILRQHPHPNIVEYRGCVVSNGRISGICLAKYKTTLDEREQELEMKSGTLEWSINGSKYEYALRENDLFALSKLREFISREPLAESTSANASQASSSATTSTGGSRDVSDS
ncbi:hypothetical protein E4U10_005295 [Claviceps purpurea]|nr:hypothetical protein E4U10_005295 [Claviceps purpurea]